jgi:pseudouridine synthase
MPRPDPKRPHAHAHGEEVRLQAFLAHSGISSRRAAEELIAAGQVFVNGKAVTAPGTKVVPGVDEIEVAGKVVEVQPVTWLALHKPTGYVTSRIDPYGRKTVYELIPEKYHGLFHVGRLDRDSEGLLLLTNEGELANRMLHPSYGVTKEYWADVQGKPTAEEMHRLTEGVDADGDVMQAESVRRLHQTGEDEHRLSVVMREGKKREVRRMLEAVGHPVARLIRRRFGPVSLGELKPGKWRILAEAELAVLREPAKRPKRAARLHSDSEEAPAAPARPPRPPADGERRPQRKPKAGERPVAAAGAGKPAARAPRPSDLRAKAREDAVRARAGEGKPRRGSQERDERPYQERATPVKRGPVKRVRDGDERPAPSTAARAPRERDTERGPSPREASRGFPRAGKAKAAGAARPPVAALPRPTVTDGDREMDSPYPQTRRASARPSPRGGASDERRGGGPDRPRPSRSRDGDERPMGKGGKPTRG